MTITQLQYVLAVAEHRNFTLAAEKCFVTQPTLSMQIQKIEEELGIQIFDRTKKPIQLTEIGQKIVSQAKNIVNEADRMQDIVEQQKGFIGGEFRLGIIPTVMPTLLPMFLSNFVKKYPKVRLIIEELNTDEIITRLKNGHLDAAIAATPLSDEKIKEIVLYFEPFVAYIPESHQNFAKTAIDVEDLNIDEILLLQDGHCFRDGILNLCRNAGKPEHSKFQIESGSFETLIRLADEGLGITLLPYLHTLDLNDKDQAKLRHFKEPKPAREVSLIYPKTELKIQIIEALRTTIAGVIKGAIVFQDIQIISPLQRK
ncbi:MAG TPA: LysR substrate-binding domain-containing protein [Flavobacterium sp.]|jgi:LysR family hydrogen peroxide-inducible transcriptional activator|nr:LysR substrate-binding domain-containing protein [Flavobacterium sp.]HPJ09407.1 LysR substrate-binding domain-containing protein [Flavobacterium sp.]